MGIAFNILKTVKTRMTSWDRRRLKEFHSSWDLRGQKKDLEISLETSNFV